MELRRTDQKYIEGVFNYLLEKTEGFVFSEVPDEPPTASEEELRIFRLKELLTFVRKTGIKKFLQMPEVFRKERTQDDWIQEAMVILYDLSQGFKPEIGLTFNRYAKYLVPRRLTSLQRTIFKKNPPVDEDLRQIVTFLKREIKREPTAEEISNFTGISREEAQRFLDVGVGQRIFEGESENFEIGEWCDCEEGGESQSSPEIDYLHKEFRKVLLDCLEKLKPNERYLIIQHYLEEVSLADISRAASRTYEAVRNQCRRTFATLSTCVRNQYQISDLA